MKNKYGKIALFMDNLRVHHNKDIKKYCEQRNIKLLYNIAYSPQYNPIEEVFSLLKNQYKRLKINSIVNEERFNTLQLIHKSVENISLLSIKNICRSGHEKFLILNQKFKQNTKPLEQKIYEHHKMEDDQQQ